MGEFGLISFKMKKVNLDNFEKGQRIYLCCHNYGCYGSMIWGGGKAALGGCIGVVIKESHHVLPVLELKGNDDQ